jgi:hypothetical protein
MAVTAKLRDARQAGGVVTAGPVPVATASTLRTLSGHGALLPPLNPVRPRRRWSSRQCRRVRP